MDVGEIRDRKSLEAWLNSLPRGTEAEREEAQRWAVIIAHRAAMRVLPYLWVLYLHTLGHLSDLDLHRFCSDQVLMLCGPLFEGHGGFPAEG